MRANLILLACLFCGWAAAQPKSPATPRPAQSLPDIPFDGRAVAPDFPAGLDWLNTAHPLSLSDLRGKIVLLDFWTYCCINCMHIIPDLKTLEAKYAKELVVIGVHSAKFENEKLTENIREAIQRYEIEHPVINDKDFQVWRSYGARSWPTLVLINPQGKVIGGHSGEGIYDLFDEVIGAALRHFEAKGLVDRREIHFQLERSRSPRSLLSYPGKIVADEGTQRLFFTDSNHNRVIVAAWNGQILECIGAGDAGLTDGSFESAQFFRPQGLCFDSRSDMIYVADTENHAIRAIDLKARTVRTLAGNGRQARRIGQEGQGAELNSPWDLILIGQKLYLAMAGPHQLWTLDTKTLEAKIYAGTGRENIVDGALRECALAQPSGITTDGERLYFADSEVSAVRAADLDPAGRVETLIGEGLFKFGDVDGKPPQARLQHCLGVAYHDGFLYVADTYNHKIRKLNPQTKELTTLIGTGKRGRADGAAPVAALNEPSGLCFAGGKMYIADANNHLIRVWDPKSGEVSTMEWKGLEKLRPSGRSPTPEAEIQFATQKITPAVPTLDLKLSLPAGTKLNPGAPSKLRVESDDVAVVRIPQAEFNVDSAALSVAISARPGRARLKLRLTLFYCEAGNAGRCYLEDVSLVLPVEVSEAGEAKWAVAHAVKAAR